MHALLQPVCVALLSPAGTGVTGAGKTTLMDVLAGRKTGALLAELSRGTAMRGPTTFFCVQAAGLRVTCV